MAASINSRFGHTRHSRDDVADAALQILDEYGLADLTMRKLASTLDVQPSALYWHFENKQALLAALADRIVGYHPVERATAAAKPEELRTAVLAESLALRDALLAYRDGAELVSSTIALDIGAAQPLARLSAAVASAGFDDATSSAAGLVLLHFILGHVSHEQQRLQADSLGVVSTGATTQPAAAADGADRPVDAFRFGIDLIVNGLVATVATATADR